MLFQNWPTLVIFSLSLSLISVSICLIRLFSFSWRNLAVENTHSGCMYVALAKFSHASSPWLRLRERIACALRFKPPIATLHILKTYQWSQQRGGSSHNDSYSVFGTFLTPFRKLYGLWRKSLYTKSFIDISYTRI